MLDQIESILRERGLVPADWATEARDYGDQVDQYRRYYDGEHDVYLSEQMKAMIRSNNGFSDNLCGLITDTMVDRLAVRGFSADNDLADAWAADLLDAARFDALQMDVHASAINDGDCYLLCEYDEDEQRVVWSVEPAWDGDEGMIVVYDRRGVEIVVAVKAWDEPDRARVNLYLPDEVRKYEIRGDYNEDESEPAAKLELIEEPAAWLPGRVPVIHFKNRSTRRRRFGVSEIKSAIPMQDALNRTIVSMIMAGELTAFPLRVAKGFTPPSSLQPGMWVEINTEDGLTREDVADAYTLEGAEPMPFLAQANFIIEQMATVTHTPLPSMMGSDAQSGEALKERKEGLAGKVERAQIVFGNAWEDALTLSALIYNTYSTQAVPVARWSSRWKDARPRDGALVREHAKLLLEAGYEREFLRVMGTVLGYDEAKIDELIDEKAAAESRALATLGGNVPGFENFALN